MLRLFAPFLPFVTEEVWRWWQEGSVHLAPWPTVEEVTVATPRSVGVFDAAATVLAAIRKEKTAAKRSMRTPVEAVTVTDASGVLALIAPAAGDIADAGGLTSPLVLTDGAPAISVTLEERTPDA